ncbi:hypothetical protein BKA81DRAFT_382417 [Phyllosticta paracitricarpa]|uniref:Uncharacterized protein n=1 Tax=Phyllosticta citricarpa TaxID=55181 RepID=A0ABR1LS10_9PEZI
MQGTAGTRSLLLPGPPPIPNTGESLTPSSPWPRRQPFDSCEPCIWRAGNASGPASGPLARYTTSQMCVGRVRATLQCAWPGPTSGLLAHYTNGTLAFGRPYPDANGNDLRSATGDPGPMSGRVWFGSSGGISFRQAFSRRHRYPLGRPNVVIAEWDNSTFWMRMWGRDVCAFLRSRQLRQHILMRVRWWTITVGGRYWVCF